LLESAPEAASDEEFEQIAEHFGVSPMVIGYQVRNQLVSHA
jgi:predicted transcriptional regulator